MIPSVYILGITTDDKLNINFRIYKSCLNFVNQLNALVTLKRFLGNEERKVLITSFVLSNSNYYPLVCIFRNAKSVQKIEATQKTALRFMLNDYQGKPSIKLRRNRSLS